MKISQRLLVALAALVLLSVAVSSPASASTPTLPHLNGYPQCVATTWAAHHYHVAKTARHTACFVKVTQDKSYVDIDPTPGGATVLAFSPAWYPQSWSSLGFIVNDKTLNPVALLVWTS